MFYSATGYQNAGGTFFIYHSNKRRLKIAVASFDFSEPLTPCSSYNAISTHKFHYVLLTVYLILRF